MNHPAGTRRRFGMGRLKDPAFAVNVQADRCGFYASLVLGRRIFWCVIPPERSEP